MTDATPRTITAHEACRRCDPARVPFATTRDATELAEPLGQRRAIEAIRLAMDLGGGYDLFVIGPRDAGKRTLMRSLLAREAASRPAPPDTCYVHDFDRPHHPRVLRLPAGEGAALRRRLEALIDDLKAAIPAALDSEQHRNRLKAIESDAEKRQEDAFDALRERSAKKGVAFLRTPMGFAFMPAPGGEVMSPDDFNKLPDEEKDRLEKASNELQRELEDTLHRLNKLSREVREATKTLRRDATMTAAGHLVDELVATYAGEPEVVRHLEAIRKDVVDNVEAFLSPDEGASALAAALAGLDMPAGLVPHRRYLVNVLVDNAGKGSAPVVDEDNPSLSGLFGRVDHVPHLGSLLTDLQLVKPGALHRANGGYLLADARQVLLQPFAWEALKRALRSRCVRIESPARELSLLSTISLEPDPVPLDAKIVLVGDRELHRLLDHLDPEFRSLFKVVADFENDVERTPETEAQYAAMLAGTAKQHGLMPFDRDAVALAVERGARLADDAGRLSLVLGPLANLLREADRNARARGADLVNAADVRAAVEARERRGGRMKDRLQDDIRDGTLLVRTSGKSVGQVNGLAVAQVGDVAFGMPTRITASVRIGSGEVVDILREVALGGPIHSKGVLILTGFLSQRYALDHPLSLRASLTFEQSYSMVEGDSASAAELAALLSALADAPVTQSLALTGSVDQHGVLQPIGGVNEKIEGFHDACLAQGMTGDQGVIVPLSNARRLMLRDDVVQAVREGRFRVVAASTIDEVMTLLTGLPAGERGEDGAFPEGSVNARVEAWLVAKARRRAALARGGDKTEDGAPKRPPPAGPLIEP